MSGCSASPSGPPTKSSTVSWRRGWGQWGGRGREDEPGMRTDEEDGAWYPPWIGVWLGESRLNGCRLDFLRCHRPFERRLAACADLSNSKLNCSACTLTTTRQHHSTCHHAHRGPHTPAPQCRVCPRDSRETTLDSGRRHYRPVGGTRLVS